MSGFQQHICFDLREKYYHTFFLFTSQLKTIIWNVISLWTLMFVYWLIRSSVGPSICHINSLPLRNVTFLWTLMFVHWLVCWLTRRFVDMSVWHIISWKVSVLVPKLLLHFVIQTFLNYLQWNTFAKWKSS